MISSVILKITGSSVRMPYAMRLYSCKADAGGDYNVVLVDLAEGVRLMSRIEGVDPYSVKIGQRVTTRVQVTDGRGLVVCDLA